MLVPRATVRCARAVPQATLAISERIFVKDIDNRTISHTTAWLARGKTSPTDRRDSRSTRKKRAQTTSVSVGVSPGLLQTLTCIIFLAPMLTHHLILRLHPSLTISKETLSEIEEGATKKQRLTAFGSKLNSTGSSEMKSTGSLSLFLHLSCSGVPPSRKLQSPVEFQHAWRIGVHVRQ